ncbi:lantibiotic protection ABC transporter ATP-binding subunit [Vaginisenegalia massiliensis]|uniref:lantibiotic protection ABC transporter ATP-binding subunit n=1 Tax=Vaginisenegalia massiliensis TaxID=2058294 RepID=UPI000F52D3E8|nr:lantibiotic protection ABC transporter ATP-binding subunit [Vaginisenegalia massiliensis]
MTNKVEMVGIKKKFKNIPVLTDITLNVENNTVYGLLGPNGSGKSTTLKILTGVLKADSGQIKIDNQVWSKDHLHKMGAMIEGPAVYPNLTAHENLLVLAKLLNIKPERIEQVLHDVNLTNTGNKIVKNFSLGMKQRLGIAMALLNNPDLLILDEPTNGLDPIGIKELRELIANFPKKGITVILSSHMLSEVQHVADKIGIIYNGKVIYEGNKSGDETELEALFMNLINKEQGL